LGSFVSTSQQNNQLLPSLLEIKPVTGTVVDSQLRDTFANRFNISGVSSNEPSWFGRALSDLNLQNRPFRSTFSPPSVPTGSATPSRRVVRTVPPVSPGEMLDEEFLTDTLSEKERLQGAI
jgi:hypothetical protein